MTNEPQEISMLILDTAYSEKYEEWMLWGTIEDEEQGEIVYVGGTEDNPPPITDKTGEASTMIKEENIDPTIIVQNVWNYIADEDNQWDTLGKDKKDALLNATLTTTKRLTGGIRAVCWRC